MSIQFKNYDKNLGFTKDYYKVRDFFLKLRYTGFTYGRWDWMITHVYLDKSAISKIGLWEENEDIVAIATFDTNLGGAFCCASEGYDYLKGEMLDYAKNNLCKDGEFAIMIKDTDSYFQSIAAKAGFIPTEGKDNDAIFPIKENQLANTLPEGYHITSLNQNFDLYQYGQVLWKGFNHEINGEGEYTWFEEKEAAFRSEMIRPNVNLDLKIAVVAPNGDFVSYCGMWYDYLTDIAVVEPVATDPAYRKLGLGKAAVLEGIKRCADLGAKYAFVGSS